MSTATKVDHQNRIATLERAQAETQDEIDELENQVEEIEHELGCLRIQLHELLLREGSEP